MVQVQDGGQVIGERFGERRIAVGNVRHKIDEIAQRNDALAVGRCRRLHEKLQKGLVLRVLVAEVICVRAAQQSLARLIKMVCAVNCVNIRRIPSNLVLQIRPVKVSRCPATCLQNTHRSASTFSSAPTLRLTILISSTTMSLLCTKSRNFEVACWQNYFDLLPRRVEKLITEPLQLTALGLERDYFLYSD